MNVSWTVVKALILLTQEVCQGPRIGVLAQGLSEAR